MLAMYLAPKTTGNERIVTPCHPLRSLLCRGFRELGGTRQALHEHRAVVGDVGLINIRTRRPRHFRTTGQRQGLLSREILITTNARWWRDKLTTHDAVPWATPQRSICFCAHGVGADVPAR